MYILQCKWLFSKLWIYTSEGAWVWSVDGLNTGEPVGLKLEIGLGVDVGLKLEIGLDIGLGLGLGSKVDMGEGDVCSWKGLR